MKPLIYLLCTFTLLWTSSTFAQDFDLKWSDKMRYDNFKDGFFKEYVGASDQFVYGLNNNLSLGKKASEKKLKLLAFDKTSMRQVKQIALKDNKDKNRVNQIKGFDYLKTVVMKDAIFVFWKKSVKDVTEVYAESFDLELNRVLKLKKVYKIVYPHRKKTLFSGLSGNNPLVIMRGETDNNTILIGSEISNGKNENYDFDYIVLESAGEEISKGKIELPEVQTSRNSSRSSTYTFGKDGNVYIKSYVRMNPSEIKNAKKGENRSYAVLDILNPESADLTTYILKYDNLNIFDIGFVVQDDHVKIYGFFNDFAKDSYGRKTHGIFTTKVDSGSSEVSEPKLSYFDKRTLDELFKNDKEERKSSQKKKKKIGKNKGNEEESLAYNYVIEDAKVVNDDLVLFCSRMYNYSVTTCTSSGSGGQSCTTRYYCSKSNVTAFKLNTEGEILWASNVDRQITYNGWDVYDLKIVTKDDKFYVLYGSAYEAAAETKNRKSAKKRTEMRDEFQYATFDIEDGSIEKRDFIVNKPGVKKAERKYVKPAQITVLDNQYFINSSRITMKPALTVAGCAASLACPPIIYFVFLSGSMRKGTGHMGTLEVIE